MPLRIAYTTLLEISCHGSNVMFLLSKLIQLNLVNSKSFGLKGLFQNINNSKYTVGYKLFTHIVQIIPETGNDFHISL